METIIKLEKEYKLRFKMGVLFHLSEITGMDGITFISTAQSNMSYSCYALITAACRCYNDKYGTNQEPSEVEVRSEADMQTFARLIELYTSFLNPTGEQAEKVENPSPSPKFKNAPTAD